MSVDRDMEERHEIALSGILAYFAMGFLTLGVFIYGMYHPPQVGSLYLIYFICAVVSGGLLVTAVVYSIIGIRIVLKDRSDRLLKIHGTDKTKACPHCGGRCSYEKGEGFWCSACSVYFE
jgi:hypothetical protein